MGIIEMFVWFWLKGYYSSILFIEYITSLESKNFEMKTNKIVKKQGFAKRSWKQLIRFDSSTQLGVPLESTSSPYYEWKGKCKDYH